jgi:hypothetical protein
MRTTLQRRANRFEQEVVIERLIEKAERAGRHCLCPHSRLAVGRNEDDRYSPVLPG